jgi:hypothetical protein
MTCEDHVEIEACSCSLCRLRSAVKDSNLCALRPPWGGIDTRTGLCVGGTIDGDQAPGD